MKITYEKAREMSVWTWDYARKHGVKPSEGMFWDRFGMIPVAECGFCEYYGRDCKECPLEWKEPKEEKNSDYVSGPRVSLPCSRNFWHWEYWVNTRNKKVWAEKMYQEILATPEHEGDA